MQAIGLYPGCIPIRIITYRINQAGPQRVRDYIPCHRLQIFFRSQRPIVKPALPDRASRKTLLPELFRGQRFEFLHAAGQIEHAVKLHEPVHMVGHGDVAPGISIGR